MADEAYPQDLRYDKEHDWVRVTGDEAVIGLTWFAQDAAGEMVYADLPSVGDEVHAGDTYGQLESGKAVSDLYAPLTSPIIEVNEVLQDRPSIVNDDCYGDGWLIRIRMSSADELDGLLDAEAYVRFLSEA